jgi:predicted phosphodiesterase
VRETELLRVGGVCVYAIHDLAELDIEPAAAGIHVVVSGHSHKPRVVERDGVLFVNPGSAGPRRFKLPVSVAELMIDDTGAVSARIVELEVQSAT